MSHFPWNFRILSGSRHLAIGVPKYIGFICSIDQNVSCVTGKRLYIIAYVAITFRLIQHILEALLVHDCVYQDRQRSCKTLNSRHVGAHFRILELMMSAATGLLAVGIPEISIWTRV